MWPNLTLRLLPPRWYLPRSPMRREVTLPQFDYRSVVGVSVGGWTSEFSVFNATARTERDARA